MADVTRRNIIYNTQGAAVRTEGTSPELGEIKVLTLLTSNEETFEFHCAPEVYEIVKRQVNGGVITETADALNGLRGEPRT